MYVSIMQPYLFPYLGYFQLVSASDEFIISDDAQYIKHGWVNRNRILVNGDALWATMPVAKASYQLSINQRKYLLNDRLASKFKRSIIGAYSKAPYFENIMPVITEILAYENPNVATMNLYQLQCIASYLGITTPMKLSSSIDKNLNLAGQDRVIEICKLLDGTGYINPIGGTSLYKTNQFNLAGLELKFLKSTADHYPQFSNQFVKSLSIIDVLMFNDLATVKRMISQYELIDGLSD